MALKKGTVIATIDVDLVTLITTGSSAKEIAIATATKVGIAPDIETNDAVKLVIKGQLLAQKPEETTITGNTITLTDNAFTPEVVQILQGGTITYDSEDPTLVVGYKPPTVGSGEKGSLHTVACYSSQRDAAGNIVRYEKITYPNCLGSPIALTLEDGVFRVNEYTIKSRPNTSDSPYEIQYVDALPAVS